MQVEIWSDVVCPWCYIGKRRFEQALAGFAHRDEVEVTWRSFQLDPTSPVGGGGLTSEVLGSRYGVSAERVAEMQAHVSDVASQVGLDYHLDRTRSGSTLDAHQLLHLAHERGVQDAVKERLLRGYFTQGESLFDHETLVRLAADAGLDRDEASRVLAEGTYADAVQADLALAGSFGIRGVPFFVIDRAIGVEGAQPAEVLRDALDQGWAAAHPLTLVTSPDGAACADGSCAT
jgi:predicted DsbA family dithiol-disulfide isomerase